jgi:uncharacterized membrane protein YsdA (DUF1294 family)/cold shock CspA family protein
MNKHGTIVRWDAQRGFGFLRSPATDADVYFHIRDFRGRGGVLPAEGLQVEYDEIHVGGKGPRAMAIEPVGGAVAQGAVKRAAPSRPGEPRRERQRTPGASAEIAAMLLLVPAYAGLLIWAAATGRIAVPLMLCAPLLWVFTFYSYWRDKFAAQRGTWRTPEVVLHVFGLVGGWPGAWLAQRLLRHKSSKRSFRAVFWASVVLHVVVLLAWFAATPGQ